MNHRNYWWQPELSKSQLCHGVWPHDPPPIQEKKQTQALLNLSRCWMSKMMMYRIKLAKSVFFDTHWSDENWQHLGIKTWTNSDLNEKLQTLDFYLCSRLLFGYLSTSTSEGCFWLTQSVLHTQRTSLDTVWQKNARCDQLCMLCVIFVSISHLFSPTRTQL